MKSERQNVEILWLIEHIAREMDVACTVNSILKSRYGVEAKIRHIYLHAGELMKHDNPRVVVTPFFYNSSDLAMNDFVKVWPDTVYFDLAWEEIFYKGHLKIKAPADEFARKRVVHHSWGVFFKEYLMEYGVEEKNIFLNGNPAYQLYLQPYSKYYPDRESLAVEHGLDKNKRWIFVPENYRWAFLTDGTINNKLKTGEDLDTMLGMREFCRQSLSDLLRWCNDIAKESGEGLEIIFRPKPVTMLKEMEDFFAERIGGQKNNALRFIKNGTVREWILASDVVISSFSTTLIEAAIAGKSVCMVEPVPISEAFSADWYEYVPKAAKYEEFKKVCTAEALNKSDRLEKWAQKEMLANGDPISNLADFAYSLIEAHKAKFPDSFNPATVEIPAKNYFNQRTHENDHFDASDIVRLMARWEPVVNSVPQESDKEKLVTIIICTYNRMPLLKLLLDSLIEQTLAPERFQVIVVDNNSKDNTKDLVNEYSEKYPHIRYVFEKEQGLSHARNRGCIETDTKYCAYLDDDAIAPPEYMKYVLAVLTQFSPDLLGGPIYPYYLSKKPKWFRDEYEIRKHAETSDFNHQCRISGGNFIIRKDVLIRVGMFNPDLGMIGNQVRLGEEREVLEKYRQTTPVGEQKTYYSLECGIKHYTPANKMTLRYVVKRGYNSGKSAARLKKKPPHKATRKIKGFFPTLYSDLMKDVKIHGIKKADYVTILSLASIRMGNIVELLSHGPKAVLGPHISHLSRNFFSRRKK